MEPSGIPCNRKAKPATLTKLIVQVQTIHGTGGMDGKCGAKALCDEIDVQLFGEGPSGGGMSRFGAPLRVGFVPLTDCAPLVIAKELGIFTAYDLEVELIRQKSWDSVRDKIIYGELDAAHAPAGLPFAANMGFGSDQCACVAGVVLSLQGNAITVSRSLWKQGALDAVSLGERVRQGEWRRTLRFGVVHPYSSHHFLLRRWLASGGLNPCRDVRIVIVPPEQMFPNLMLGNLDGYCVGEPWNSVAVQAGAGVCLATSASLAPKHPEKILMVRHAFAIRRAGEHERLVAALLDACAFCDRPANKADLAECLAKPGYVNAPLECIKAALLGPFEYGDGTREVPFELTLFHRENANAPDESKATWVMNCLYDMLETGAMNGPFMGRTPVIRNVFRPDIHNQALKLCAKGRVSSSETKNYEIRTIVE